VACKALGYPQLPPCLSPFVFRFLSAAGQVSDRPTIGGTANDCKRGRHSIPESPEPGEDQFFDPLLEQKYLCLHSELLLVPYATQSLRTNQKLQVSLDPYITLEYTGHLTLPIASNAAQPNHTEGRFGCVVSDSGWRDLVHQTLVANHASRRSIQARSCQCNPRLSIEGPHRLAHCRCVIYGRNIRKQKET
jgi:hypothetical protein